MSGSYKWKVTILRWPYFGVPQERAGDEQTVFEVSADNIFQAAEQAKLYQAGVKSNPNVWECPIVKIEQVR